VYLSTKRLEVKVDRPITEKDNYMPAFADLLFSGVIVGGSLAIVFNGGMSMIVGLVNGMQLIIHMPIFDI
jgi:hypothetical protein